MEGGIKMGQYYNPINIESMEWLYSHDYGDGLKLMEHSYIGNKFVGAVMKLLTKGNKWYKKPIVWCGDYAEEKYYEKCKDDKNIFAESLSEDEQKTAILVNHTKKEYIYFYPYRDEKKKRVVDKIEGNEEEWVINPLPLLTALGNGQGGGDYRGINIDKVGIWAKDILSVEFEIPEGYKEFKVEFKE